jgi:hypothetical protein
MVIHLAALETGPYRIVAEPPGALDVRWLLVSYGVRCEDMLALGDPGPNNHGCGLPLPVSELRLDAMWPSRGKLRKELLPGVRVDAPVLECFPSPLVVNQMWSRVQFVGEDMKDSLELLGVFARARPAVKSLSAGSGAF